MTYEQALELLKKELKNMTIEEKAKLKLAVHIVANAKLGYQ